MKNYLFASAFAVAALMSTSAFAQVSGYAGAAYAHAHLDTPLGDVKGDGYALAAAVFAPVNETIGFQVDATAADAEDADPALGATVHLVADAGGARFGGFASVLDVEEDTMWAFGGEAQAAVTDKVTLAGVLAYATLNDADIDIVGAGGEARVFATDNLRIGGALGYLDVQDVDVSAWTYGVEAEYQLTAMPISVFGGVNRVDMDDFDVTIDTISVGVRYNFGGQTLKARDQDGASLPGLTGLSGVAAIL